MNSAASGDEAPKIIIDEDWKSQAQAEKERLERTRTGGPELPRPKPAAPAAPPSSSRPRPPVPQPSLAMLATSIATQAMIALGVTLDPLHPEAVEPDFAQARHLIDTLQMLHDKTAGNRTPEEDIVLGDLLHEARMAYVSLQSAPPPSPSGGSGEFGMSA